MSYLMKAVSPLALMAALSAYSTQAWADQQSAPPPTATPAPATAAPTTADNSLAEVVVTARRQSENLQKVPDSITAFTSAAITNAGIQNLSDLSEVTPDLNFRDGRGYAANFFDLRLRGIGQAQSGWPAAALIVDGVPAPSSDALTTGSFEDLERIEVLRGPQSALYGAGAIAGAINVITKRPTDTPEAEARVFYGNGNDLQADGSVSGALVQDKLFGRLAINYTNDDGRINSASNGIHLDPTYSQHYETRLIWDPISNFEADIHASYDTEKVGFAYQDRVPTTTQINDYSSAYDPRRNYPGRQVRDLGNFSVRLKWDAGPVIATSVSSYSQGHQTGFGDACYDDVNSPGVFANPDGSVSCLSNVVAYGNKAQPGQVVDAFQAAIDDYSTFFQDFRLTSAPGGAVQWVAGADGMTRNALDGYFSEENIAGSGVSAPIYQRDDQKYDGWLGVYGQLGYTYGKWELSVAGRYDDQFYQDTGYTSPAKTVVIPATSSTGALENTQTEKAFNFQPKGQVSYHIDPDKMAYVTISEGFRAGYFNSGSFGAPEHTVNYEGGIKTEWLDRRLQANISVFHIDYSNQQLSETLLNPPYRVPVTIPKTNINGTEFETAYLLFHGFTLNGDLSYLDATAASTNTNALAGTQSPKSPHWSGAVGGQLNEPLYDGWALNAHADISFHSDEYLYLNNTQEIPSAYFVNARIGVEKDRLGIYFVGRNLTNTIEDEMQTSVNPLYAVRYRSEPASYGVELRVKY